MQGTRNGISTSFPACTEVKNHKSLKIITNNLHVAQICAANPGFEVIIAGGVVRQRDFGVIGEATIERMLSENSLETWKKLMKGGFKFFHSLRAGR